MSKSTRMTPEQLRLMNLEEVEPGVYKKKKTKAGKAAELVDDINIATAKLQNMFPDIRKNPLTPDDCIKPFDIAAVRALGSGTKKRKQSMEDLHQFAKKLVENRGVDSIYIEGNVPSSKNSKEIAKFKKRVNGKLVDMASLIDSKVTAKYKKEKANTYALHKHRFLEMIQGKTFPVSVQFTFIRKDIGRFDFGNAQQVVADLMVDHKWIPDDCTEYFVPVFNPVVYYSVQHAGVIIKVL